jgi:hypothetical protein
MIIQAHYTDNLIASIDLNIYTGEYLVKINRGGKLEKTGFKQHDKALQHYMAAIRPKNKNEISLHETCK